MDTDGDYPQEIRVPISSMQYVQLRDEKADKNYKTTNRQRVQFIIGSIQYSIDVWKNIYGREEACVLRFSNSKHI